VDCLSSLNHLGGFEQNMFAAEQHGDEVDKAFVNEAERDELLCNVCAQY
jgi:hypothetical protein